MHCDINPAIFSSQKLDGADYVDLHASKSFRVVAYASKTYVRDRLLLPRGRWPFYRGRWWRPALAGLFLPPLVELSPRCHAPVALALLVRSFPPWPPSLARGRVVGLSSSSCLPFRGLELGGRTLLWNSSFAVLIS